MKSYRRRILIAGASGLVGGILLKSLLADDSVAEVHVLARRQIACDHGKIRMHVVDFRLLPQLPPIDELYLALGTTIKLAGSQEAFRAVDFDANLAVASAAIQAGARRIGLVSAMGASAKSSVFYNRVKGELEEAVLLLGAESVVIARPSLLLGDRAALGQPTRTGEKFAQGLMGSLNCILPLNLRPIRAEKVARALLCKVPDAKAPLILSSAELQAF